MMMSVGSDLIPFLKNICLLRKRLTFYNILANRHNSFQAQCIMSSISVTLVLFAWSNWTIHCNSHFMETSTMVAILTSAVQLEIIGSVAKLTIILVQSPHCTPLLHHSCFTVQKNHSQFRSVGFLYLKLVSNKIIHKHKQILIYSKFQTI